MVRKIALGAAMLLAVFGFSSAGAATKAPKVGKVTLAGNVVEYMATSAYAASAPKPFDTVDQFGNALECARVSGSDGATTMCLVPTATSAPVSKTDPSEDHLPNPPFGLCFSQHIVVRSTSQGQPRNWVFICVCVPNPPHQGEPHLLSPYLFQDIEGNPAFGDPTANPSSQICVGARTIFDGLAWVCILRLWF
jgi:hypothetical protein